MTDEEYIKYLELHDDQKNLEFPPDTDYENELTRLNEFVAELENHGVILDGKPDDQAQDASYFSDVPIEGTRLVISNFGNMIAFYDDESISPSTLKLIQELAEKCDYVFIPSKYLQRKYTHSNPKVTCVHNWWIRYFDYL